MVASGCAAVPSNPRLVARSASPYLLWSRSICPLLPQAPPLLHVLLTIYCHHPGSLGPCLQLVTEFGTFHTAFLVFSIDRRQGVLKQPFLDKLLEQSFFLMNYIFYSYFNLLKEKLRPRNILANSPTMVELLHNCIVRQEPTTFGILSALFTCMFSTSIYMGVGRSEQHPPPSWTKDISNIQRSHPRGETC